MTSAGQRTSGRPQAEHRRFTSVSVCVDVRWAAAPRPDLDRPGTPDGSIRYGEPRRLSSVLTGNPDPVPKGGSHRVEE